MIPLLKLLESTLLVSLSVHLFTNQKKLFNMILIWGMPTDEPTLLIWKALNKRGATIAFLDQNAALQTKINLKIDKEISGTITVDNQQIALEQISAAYLRPYDSSSILAVKDKDANSPEKSHVIVLEDTIISWSEITTAFIVNKPSAMASNTSKPYQEALIRAAGFAIPETLITTDKNAALEFIELHEDVIYKSISAVRSIVSRFSKKDIDRLGDLAWCPTQFQEYIPGHDFRVHVVGNQLFPCEIVSTSDDYRYAGREGGETKMESVELPRECATRCIELAAALDLPVAGIDLRQHPRGEWYCLEVNPSPGFSYFQNQTNAAIDEAIADLLMAA